MYLLLTVFILAFIYFLYQLFRNDKVFEIKIKWIDEKKWDLYYKYSYEFMFNANKHNLYGLKWPSEKNYD